MDKNKGKEKESNKTSSKSKNSSYKTALEKPTAQLRAEALKATPKELKLREDAYSISVRSNMTNEFIYPYIPSSTMWIAPIEIKYPHLAPTEVTSFYLRDSADPFLI